MSELQKKGTGPRYRRFPIGRWRDPRYLGLSSNGRDVHTYISTGPCTTKVPGLVYLVPETAAAEMGRDLRTFKKGLAEVLAAGLAEYDPAARLLWRKDALEEQPPDSHLNILGWHADWSELPACELLGKACAHLASWCATKDSKFSTALENVTGRAFPHLHQEDLMEVHAKPGAGAGAEAGTGAGAGRPSPAAVVTEKRSESGSSKVSKVSQLEAVVAELQAQESLLAGMHRDDIEQLAQSLVSHVDIRLPTQASLAPYVRKALQKLRTAVLADPGKKLQDRLRYLDSTTVGLTIDDKLHGYASGKTNGEQGVCAPRSSQRGVKGVLDVDATVASTRARAAKQKELEAAKAEEAEQQERERQERYRAGRTQGETLEVYEARAELEKAHALREKHGDSPIVLQRISSAEQLFAAARARAGSPQEGAAP